MNISSQVWLSIPETNRRLISECVKYVVDNGKLPSMFKYQWALLDTTQKLLVEFIFSKFGFAIDSQGNLGL